ncbi:MAG TPA: tRNA 4-thiouridine(8) synthase ThiI, partial [Candidatus Aenigmarchaeota archaeon]|nr:tRNA 4-thiouridine(8) synthase ThiI [Candidatus Aenigmarchaeota archaeon]
MKLFVVNLGELWLKSEPVKRIFLNKLVDNIKSMLIERGIKFKIRKERDKIFVYANKSAGKVLKNVFGITSFSFAEEVETDYESIAKAVRKMAKGIRCGESFAISVNRSWKGFKYTSKEMERMLGALIKRKVDLENPDKVIYVDIRKDNSYVYMEREKGLGGMPISTAGRVISLFSGGFDSAVASFMMMKRGCSIELVYFYNYPFSPKSDRERVIAVAKVLRKYYPKSLRLYIIPFAKIEEGVMNYCHIKYACLIGRRIMIRIAEKIARMRNAKALVSGENLSQVASQTLENMASVGKASTMLILRPLVGFDKNEIIEMAKQIGVYEKSSKISSPCPLTHKRPATKSEPKTLEEEEDKIKGLQE